MPMYFIKSVAKYCIQILVDFENLKVFSGMP